MVRLWAHEALRLFQDRLVFQDERDWCDVMVDQVAHECFPSVNSRALDRPMIFSSYLSKNYASTDVEELRKFVIAKLKTFNEEEYDIQLVVFDEVLDHISRIDRVLRQPIGHCLLVGASGVGKTTLSRFVSWMNNLSVFQIKAGRNYSINDFDNDLRGIMKRAGCYNEKITFIFDESNVLSVAFLERMNALLASGEVPGLFEGDEYLQLMNACKEGMGPSVAADTEEEIYKKFIRQTQRNLHVVFTMNPSSPDFSNRAGSSPAIFNRCVIDWFGEWSNTALLQVAKELTEKLDFPDSSFDDSKRADTDNLRHELIVDIIVYCHKSVQELNAKLQKSAKKFNYITPRDFLDFIRQFIALHNEKKSALEDSQFHINSGLKQLKDTEENVLELKSSLKEYKIKLSIKEKEAKEKLDLMMQEQSRAEKRKTEAELLTEKIEVRQVTIVEKTYTVETELA